LLKYDIENFINRNSTNGEIDIFKYTSLWLTVWLDICDILIMLDEIVIAGDSLQTLERKIHTIQKDYADKEFLYQLNVILCWTLNRRAIINKKKFQIKEWIAGLYNALRLAIEINHPYYTHHCYYDLAQPILLEEDKWKGFELNNKACNHPILTEPRYRSAKVRSMIQDGFMKYCAGEYDKAETTLLDAIDNAATFSYHYELIRGLLYLSSVLLLTKQYDQAKQHLKMALKLLNINQSVAFRLRIYSNCIFLILHNYVVNKDNDNLHTCITYINESFELLFNIDSLKISMEFWSSMVMNNLKMAVAMLKEICGQEYISGLKEKHILHLQKINIPLHKNSEWFEFEKIFINKKNKYQFYAIFN
jgi:tetratricopeptide (TPR) repeat protein